MLEEITPLLLTYNEEANLRRQLESLAWARRVVIVDSESTDGTRAIATEFPNTAFVVRPFDELARQWNFGLEETAIDTGWVLALDADYGMPPEFFDELRWLRPAPDVDGYRARFLYCIDGKPLRSGLYGPVTVLFRRARGRYAQDGHTQRLKVPGRIETLATPLLHDDRKPIARWYASQIGYMRLEAEHLLDTPVVELRLPDRIRRLVVVAPWLVFFYCLIVKGGLLDGRRGVFYALQRAFAEVILSAFLVEGRLRRQGLRR